MLLNDIEFDLPCDPQRQTLQQTLTMLMPIRRQRLNRAQRQLRQQKMLLEQARQQQAAQQQRLLQQQQHYQQQRAAFRYCHQTLETLAQRLANEQAALQAMGQQQQQYQQAQQQQQTATLQLDQAVRLAREQHKALEKLEYLSEYLLEEL
ncbi:type III secretion system protein [Serratia marcescens]|uniref:type III secretion system protein n=1 Tax=Serratia marcescens TaxID=615 RepID=UPI000D730223|nr:type III secretion system protein [Serratia marcescens]AWO77466.1 type III secretion system protein [Serratia marcescens]HDU5650207.1 type III secretion system protein [Klebsiella aerogenes]